MTSDLKVALITGGNRGIGLAIANKFKASKFVFASSENDNIYIFRNEMNKYKILDNDTIQFEEAPIQF